MINNAFVDIAIGLVLMYLVLSLMGTVVNEFISTTVGLRASTLKNALQKLLDDQTLRSAFYQHGMIDGTKQATGVDHPSYISGESFALAIVGSIDPNNPLPGFDEAKAAVGKMPDSNIKDVLLAQLAKANGSLDKFRLGVANYFDGAMDRVSGTYKRYLKWISLGVGFLIVIALNADSIKVGAALWKDASLRAQMVETAQTVLTDTTTQLTKGTSQKPTSISERLTTLDDDIRPLPIGMTAADVGYVLSLSEVKSVFTKAGFWALLTKLFGLVITAFAISLGAPFWFDMLSKLMNVRGAGPKPDSTTATAAPTTSTATVPPAGQPQAPA